MHSLNSVHSVDISCFIGELSGKKHSGVHIKDLVEMSYNFGNLVNILDDSDNEEMANQDDLQQPDHPHQL